MVPEIANAELILEREAPEEYSKTILSIPVYLTHHLPRFADVNPKVGRLNVTQIT